MKTSQESESLDGYLSGQMIKIEITDCCTPETNTTLYQLYSNKN